MSFFIISILVLVLGFVAYKYLTKPFNDFGDVVPGVKPHLILGNMLNSGILSGKITFHEIMLDYQRRFGDKFVFWFGSSPNIAFCSAEQAQTIFSNRQIFDQSPLFLPNFDLLCPHNIFMPTGPKWKRHARAMMPMFKRAKIIQHVDVICRCVDQIVDQHFRDGEIVRDVLQICRSLATNVFGWIAFDEDFDQNMDSSVKEGIQYFALQSVLVMVVSWMPRWILKIYLRLNWKYQKGRQAIHQLTSTIFEREKNNPHLNENDRPQNLIASLVKSLNEQANDEDVSSGMTQDEIFDEILVSILAGYETTSTTMSWFVYFASKYPEVQHRMRTELREHHLLATRSNDVPPPLTSEQVDSLVYCDCVTKEVLRLAPVAGMTTRIALQDTVVDDIPIRRGQTVLIGTHNINTDPRYWHAGDSKKFIPERFLGEDQNHHQYALLPFGGGHRACLGQDLARFELKVFIIRLMQRGLIFEDTPDNTGGCEEQLTCYPKKIAVRIRHSFSSDST